MPPVKGMTLAMQATKVLRKGCKGFIGHVRTVMVNQSGPGSVLVVREFLDVFLEELPELPLEREIDFEINLIPNTKPMSIPPNMMAPIELNELKEQL